MAILVYDLIGIRGRRLKLYDTKCVIITDKTVGSFISGNIADGEKTIFLKDVVGVQFKESGLTIGYLQFETPSMQMNNQNSNFFSENTFTFETGKNDVTNELMREVYDYAVSQIEALKYGLPTIPTPVAAQSSEKATIIPQKIPPRIPREAPAAATYETWKCHNCGTENKTSYTQCKKCGKYKGQAQVAAPSFEEPDIAPAKIPGGTPAAPKETWKCQQCGTENKTNYMQCKKCGKYKGQS